MLPDFALTENGPSPLQSMINMNYVGKVAQYRVGSSEYDVDSNMA